jgi:hypothetical protein
MAAKPIWINGLKAWTCLERFPCGTEIRLEAADSMKLDTVIALAVRIGKAKGQPIIIMLLDEWDEKLLCSGYRYGICVSCQGDRRGAVALHIKGWLPLNEEARRN